MRLIVEESHTADLEAFVRFLRELSSLTGERVDTLIGPKETTFDLSTTLLQSATKCLKSLKSDDSKKQEFQPLQLRLTVDRSRNGFVSGRVFWDDKMGPSAVVASVCMNEDEKIWASTTFTVNTSLKPTSTERMFSKEELLTSFRRSGDKKKQEIERFINAL